MKKTMENCRLVKKFGKPNQYDGVCEGFCKGEYDDEPCEKCKGCKFFYLNEVNKEFN